MRPVLGLGREAVAPHLELARVAGVHDLRVQPVAVRQHHRRTRRAPLDSTLARVLGAVEHAALVLRPACALHPTTALELDLSIRAVRNQSAPRELLAFAHHCHDDARTVRRGADAQQRRCFGRAGLRHAERRVGGGRGRLHGDRRPAAEPGHPARVGKALRSSRARRDAREREREREESGGMLGRHLDLLDQNVRATPTDVASPPRPMSRSSM